MGTWIVGVIVLAIVALAARKLYKDRKRGKGCGCEGCSGCDTPNDCKTHG